MSAKALIRKLQARPSSRARLCRVFVALTTAALVAAPALPARAVPVGGNGDFLVVQGSGAPGGNLEILRLSPDGGDPVNLTNSGLHQNEPVWSPDGRRIAYSSSTGVWIMRGDGTGSEVLIRPGAASIVDSPAWSPDGTEIAYVRRFFDPDGNVTRSGIHVLDLGSGKSRYVAPAGIRNNEIDWSPDGSRLVFQHWRYLAAQATYGSHVMVVNADGTELTDLTDITGGTDRDWRPSWLRDGRIVFRRYGSCLPIFCVAGFYAVHPDGSGLELLPLRPTDWTGDGQIDSADRLRQSPDGTGWSVLVYDSSAESHQLWKLDRTMTKRKKLFAPVFWFVDWQPRCTVRGTASDDLLRGTDGRDLICGFGGDDTIKGRGGNDVLFGHVGKDRVMGGPGRDIVVGNGGSDRCDRDEKDHSRVC